MTSREGEEVTLNAPISTSTTTKIEPTNTPFPIIPKSQQNHPSLTLTEVSSHNTPSSLWLVLGNTTNGGQHVYNITSYLSSHPGGEAVLLDCAGTDADDLFEDLGHSPAARKLLSKYKIGVLHLSEDEKRAAAAAAASAHSASPHIGEFGAYTLVFALLAILWGRLT